MKKLIVDNREISLKILHEDTYISLTDIAKSSSVTKPADTIANWLRRQSTLLYIETWEKVHNTNFDLQKMERIRLEAPDNLKKINAQRIIEETNAIGMVSKSGRYGGTFAHQEIAMDFCSWLSPVFKVYLYKEFQRLKEEEAASQNLEWSVKRIMTKANYGIMTSAVKEYLIPVRITSSKLKGMYFASEADLINLAIFGRTAKEWKLANPDLKGNMRDHATVEQLLVLSNAQSMNSKLIEWGEGQEERFRILNEMAIKEMQILLSGKGLKGLK